jgi:hypothetical protein
MEIFTSHNQILTSEEQLSIFNTYGFLYLILARPKFAVWMKEKITNPPKNVQDKKVSHPMASEEKRAKFF